MNSRNKEDIIKLFVVNNGRILDNHTSDQEEIAGYALVEFVSDSRDLAVITVPRKESNGQSLNYVYIDNNELHLSMQSAGMLWYKRDMQHAIEKYNKDSIFEGRKIKRLYFPDGSTLEAQI